MVKTFSAFFTLFYILITKTNHIDKRFYDIILSLK